MLSGLQQKEVELRGGDWDGKFLFLVYYCKDIYLYQQDVDEFYYSEADSEYIKLSEEIRDVSTLWPAQ